MSDEHMEGGGQKSNVTVCSNDKQSSMHQSHGLRTTATTRKDFKLIQGAFLIFPSWLIGIGMADRVSISLFQHLPLVSLLQSTALDWV